MFDSINKKLRQFFTTSDGQIVIGQWPNWPLWLAIFFWVIQYLPVDQAQQISQWGMKFSLIYWAYLEIRYGVNSFRRLLGMIVMSWILISLV